MEKTLFVLKEVSDFAPGAFENTAVEEGSIQLGRSGGKFLPSGCYTSPAFRMPAFMRMVPSWNAATPLGTAVEVQVRIASGNKWSKWFSFGKWSPFIHRASLPLAEDEIGRCAGGMVELQNGVHPADMAQIRIYLYSDDATLTPMVHLLGASADPLRRERGMHTRAERMLQLPEYSCLVREPSIATAIATPTTLCMLMNRWGEDTLPEEVAHACYDSETGMFNNIAFATAIAGAYGYECYAAYADIDLLRREVRRGACVGAFVRYRAPMLGKEMESAFEETPGHRALPVLDNATTDSYGHFVAVRGFARKGEEEWVVMNDPLAPDDTAVRREMPLAQFAQLHTGLCLMLHRGAKGAGDAAPQRLVGQADMQEGSLVLHAHGQQVLPAQPQEEALPRMTICYTLPEGVAYASAAQKKFYYLPMDENGKVPVSPKDMRGQKAAFYCIGNTGTTWVAEKTIADNTMPEESALEEG